MKYKNINFFFLLPFAFSILLIYFSLNNDLWKSLWSFLNIPSQLPPFSDLDSIIRALKSKNEGLDPYFNNPYDLSQKPYSYTSLWLHIFEIFKLDNDFNFKLLNFLIIFLYVFIYFKLSQSINLKLYSTFLLLSFFSTSSLLLLERLNIDIIIFILVFFYLSQKNYILNYHYFSFQYF